MSGANSRSYVPSNFGTSSLPAASAEAYRRPANGPGLHDESWAERLHRLIQGRGRFRFADGPPLAFERPRDPDERGIQQRPEGGGAGRLADQSAAKMEHCHTVTQAIAPH